MDTSKLRPDTAAVWAAMGRHPLLRGFVLIGGTAMTLRVGHRVSEDLDFSFAGPKLPRVQLAALARDLADKGVSLLPAQDPLDEEEFFNSGLELADYQQNFVAVHGGLEGGQGRVKVSLVCYDPPVPGFIKSQVGDPVRVATLDEIFDTKVWVCSARSKTRDWLDLFVLITQCGYSFDDMLAVFRRAGQPAAFNNASMRLRSGRPELGDEGYVQLMDKAPTLDELREFFNRELDGLEVRLAEDAFRARAIARSMPEAPG